MSQISYGTITITDTNDISQIYMVYAGGSSGSISPTLSWTTINNNTWKRDITQVTGLYIWESTVITKTGITITETNWQDFYHTPVCITGPEGKGVDSIVTKYCNYGTGTPVEAYTGWQNNPPSYNENKPNYWVKNIITYNDNTSVVNIYKDNGITDAMTLAAEANATANEAKDIADEALELVTETDENLIIYLDSQGLTKEALSTPTRYIWKNMDSYINGYTYEKAGLWTKPDYPSGTYMASGYIDTSTSKPTIDTEDYNTYRFNTYMTNSGLYLRYNDIKFTELNTGALIFYYPKQDLSQTSPYVQGESALKINTDGLKIYNKYTGTGNSESETNLANRLALSLTTSGLQLYEAGNSIASFESQFIRLGQSGDSRVQIQNDSNYSGVEIFRKVNDTDGAQSMAWFGTNKSTGVTTARIGYQNGARFVTSSGSLDAYSDTNPNNAYFHVDANSLTYGDYTAATTAQVEATNLALAQKTGRYAECSTAAATQLKVATITPAVTGWTLSVGMTITVKFTYANTNTTPKLKVNGYGESLIRSYKNTVLSADEAKWAAGTIIDFKWDGNNWLLQDMGTEAAKTASNYMCFDETNGLSISNASPATATNKVQIKATEIKIQQSANNYASITTDGMAIYKSGAQVASFGSEVIIGSTSGTNKNIWITSGYVNFREGTTEVGYIGSSSARFGKSDSSRFIISSNKLQAYSDETTKYFEVSASGITYGSKTVANTDDTAAAAKTATNYLDFSDSYGLNIRYVKNNAWVNQRINIQADGIRLYDKDGNACGFFGTSNNSASIRLGNTNEIGHIRIGLGEGVRFLRDDDSTKMAQLASDGLQIWKYTAASGNVAATNTSVAFFGENSRIGAADADGNVRINSTGDYPGFHIVMPNFSRSYVTINSSGARFGRSDKSYLYINNTEGTLGLLTYVPATETTDARAQRRIYCNSDGIYLYDLDSGKLKIFIGSYIQLGATNDTSYAYMTTNGFSIYTKAAGETNATSTVFLGVDENNNYKPYARIGRTSQSYVAISSTELSLNQSSTKYVSITSNGMKITNLMQIDSNGSSKIRFLSGTANAYADIFATTYEKPDDDDTSTLTYNIYYDAVQGAHAFYCGTQRSTAWYPPLKPASDRRITASMYINDAVTGGITANVRIRANALARSAWWNARDNATIVRTWNEVGVTDAYYPFLSFQTSGENTSGGDWSIGDYQGRMYFSRVSYNDYTDQTTGGAGHTYCYIGTSGDFHAQSSLYTGAYLNLPNDYGVCSAKSTGTATYTLIKGTANNNIQIGSDSWNNCYIYRVYTSTSGTVTDAANVRITSEHRLARYASSSERYKEDIELIQDNNLKPELLYELPIKQFKYHSNYIEKYDSRADYMIPGFIVEDIEKVYSIAVDYDADGNPEDWNVRYIVPPMLALVQEQHKDIEQLKEEIQNLKSEIQELKQLIK